MFDTAALRPGVSEDLPRTPFRASTCHFRRNPEPAKRHQSDPLPPSGEWLGQRKADENAPVENRLNPKLNGAALPAPILLGRSVSVIGFVDGRLASELDALFEGNSDDDLGLQCKRVDLRHFGNCNSGMVAPLSVPAPIQTRRRLYWTGFLDAELLSELEDVSRE